MDAVASKDKRVKREIANSNERRRMQSINAGFQKLKRLLPVKDGEKISKANILQHAADYIQKIQQERLKFYEDNAITLMKRENITTTTGSGGCGNEFSNFNNANNTNSNNPDTSNNKDKNNSTSNNSNTRITNNNRDRNSNRTRVRTKKSNRTKNGSLDEYNNNNNDIIINNSTNNNNSISGNQDVVDRSISSHELASQSMPIGSVAGIISDKATSPKDGMAKAAIALPLEVPYTIELNPSHQQHHHQNSSAGSKGQNLDIICKAIMEIEGVATSNLTTL